jgi:hypothetical protein
MSIKSVKRRFAPDNHASYNHYISSHDDRGIIWEYVHGTFDAKTAIRYLEVTTPQGILWAGEIALEQAYKIKNCDEGQTAKKNEEAYQSLINAQKLFDRAYRLGQLASMFTMDQVMARARVQSALMPIHAIAIQEGTLPNAKAASKAYERTVEVGRVLVDEHQAVRQAAYRSPRARNELINISGFTGEMAAMLPIQRKGLQDIGPDSMFAVFSLLSKDNRNTGGSSVNHGWDVSVVDDYGGYEDPAYRVQAKTSRRADRYPSRPDESGISLIHIDPDLRISKGESFIPYCVLEECYQELNGEGESSGATARLDERTENYLDKLDETRAVQPLSNTEVQAYAN